MGDAAPVGQPSLIVNVPIGKRIISIDVSGDEPTVVYAEYPKSETAVLKEQIDNLTIALAQIMGV